MLTLGASEPNGQKMQKPEHPEPERLPVGWPFPPNGRPVPPTAAQLEQDQRAELEALGEALF